MQVVDDEQQRGPDGLHERRRGFEEAVTIGLASCLRGVPERGKDGRQVGEPVGDGGIVAQFGRAYEEVAQRLGEGLERRERLLVAASVEHAHGLRFAGCAGGEARLPDPRLAGQQHHARSPVLVRPYRAQ